MAELRWGLVAAGIVILVVVFWLGRREARGQKFTPPEIFRRRSPALGPEPGVADAAKVGPGKAGGAAEAMFPPGKPQRIITVRLTAHEQAGFGGEALILALREAGLRHGRFGIFHRHDQQDDSRILFSVASLVEPGSFDLAKVKAERFPGVSLFLVLPHPGDCIAAFDDMLNTARALARQLDGELLDEKGSRLSVQRERYLREEVIQFQHKLAAS